jgi:hypothetical protein
MVRAVNAGKEVLWRSRLQRFQASGLSVTQFCERERISQPSFYQWRKRLGVSTAQSTASPFVPVRLTQVAMVEIHLPNGVRISVPPGSADSLRVAIEAAGRCRADENMEVDTCSR